MLNADSYVEKLEDYEQVKCTIKTKMRLKLHKGLKGFIGLKKSPKIKYAFAIPRSRPKRPFQI